MDDHNDYVLSQDIQDNLNINVDNNRQKLCLGNCILLQLSSTFAKHRVNNLPSDLPATSGLFVC